MTTQRNGEEYSVTLTSSSLRFRRQAIDSGLEPRAECDLKASGYRIGLFEEGLSDD
jgi:hypothetical protein